MEKCFICETGDSFKALDQAVYDNDVIEWRQMEGTVYIYFEQTGK